MSIWVRVFCQETVAGATPEQLRAGIAQRLRLLIYLFCTEDDEVLERLRIERYTGRDEFQAFLLHYRREGGAERWYRSATGTS